MPHDFDTRATCLRVSVPVHDRDPKKFQHQGFGKLLMEKSEEIARRNIGVARLRSLVEWGCGDIIDDWDMSWMGRICRNSYRNGMERRCRRNGGVFEMLLYHGSVRLLMAGI